MIKSLRTEKNLSQEDMAKNLGMNQMTISRIESGQREITFEEMRKICHMLKIRMTKLIRELEKIEKTATEKAKVDIS
ncbi:MAG: helix-turn-helix transcriptional regulator [Bacteriovoracaceae bacterium]|nr:helix-turn-helix transcriptional regulator [Bacteriovoracaceae bacterium]